MSSSVLYTGLSSLELNLSTEQSLPPEATTLVSCYIYYNNYLIILTEIQRLLIHWVLVWWQSINSLFQRHVWWLNDYNPNIQKIVTETHELRVQAEFL